MKTSKILVCLIVAALASGCAQLGLKSVPWPTSSDIHDAEAMDFLRGAPPIDSTLGEGLSAKPMLDDGRLVGLSVSGGGARAAAFTLGVLTELQELGTSDKSNALDRVDFISSNSGGSWGVAAYLSDRATSKNPHYRLLDRAPLSSGKASLIGRFVRMSSGKVRCWSRAMNDHLFRDQTYGEVYSPANPVPLPRAFINASLLPSHSPFVFNDSFLRHYAVESFGSCKDSWVPPVRRIADLPFGYAAAASGTVPGFYHAYAKTGLCTGGTRSASFCHSILKGRPRDYLRIADGGLYDNIGYKTAYEVMLSQAKAAGSARKAMILVNSNPSTDFQSIAPSEKASSFFSTTAKNGLFAVQDSTFERLYRPMFESLGVSDPLLLDFYSVARFRPEQAGLLHGLNELAFYAAHNVHCYSGERLVKESHKVLPLPAPEVAESLAHLSSKGGDCLSENFYRAGTLGKTTYKADGPLFTILWQLGRLSVRMQRDEILAAVN